MRNHFFLLLTFLVINISFSQAQMITGVWKGKVGMGIRPAKLELKLIQRGDSLFGTSYYYESSVNYRRYTVKGYFNQQSNEVVWWDDELIELKSQRVSLTNPGSVPMLMEADFNCPGSGIMMLDGKAVAKEDQKKKTELHLNKMDKPLFKDEWDYVIENFTAGANDPEFINSVVAIHKTTKKPEVAVLVKKPEILQPQIPAPVENKEPVKENSPQITKTKEVPVVIAKAPAIEEKFIERKKILTTELPLEGDTIEIHFYDNAEIDGDSISLFMNNKLVFEHVRLSDKPYIVKFAVSDLSETNELVMVAENLGSIPPNTSFMIAYVNNQRYTANLESTENSSAMIRFVRRQ